MFPSTSSYKNDDQPAVDCGLIQRLQAGNTDAFVEVYDQYSRILYGLILRMVRNPALAEDLLQEIFLKLWRSAATLDGKVASPGPWLIAVARNHVLDYFKSGQNQRAIKSASLDLRELSKHVSFPEHDFVIEESAQGLRKALEHLDPRQRAVLELAYFEGLSQSEMAQTLNLPLGTVKSCVRLALRNLKTLFEKENP